MSGYTKTNLRSDVENASPKFGMPPELEARFARGPIEGKTLGLSLMKLAPNFRIPFGHKHSGQEEVYVVLAGSAELTVGGERVQADAGSLVRVEPEATRRLVPGAEGVRILAIGCAPGGGYERPDSFRVSARA